MAVVWLLIAINVAIPAAALITHCGFRRIQIDHVATFTLGYLLYWILPIALGLAGVFRSEPPMRLWYAVFDSVSPAAIGYFLVISACSYLTFLAGTYWGSRVRLGSLSRFTYIGFDRRLLRPLLWLALLLLAGLTVAFRDRLLTGYAGFDDPWTPDPARSAFASLGNGLMVLLLLHTAAGADHAREGRSGSSLPANDFLLAFVVASLLLVSMGTRLYAASAVLMLCIYRSVFFKRISLFSVLALAGAGLGLTSLIGLWRRGAEQYQAVAAVFGEPLYIAMSLLHFLGRFQLPLLRLPGPLLSDFVNLIPTFLWPAKTNLLSRPEDFDYELFSPGGGINAFFSFTINFGIVGTVAAMFMIGVGAGALRSGSGAPVVRVMYVMISGWLAFTFFRDPFYVSIVKCIVEFSVLMPAALVVGLHLCTQLTMYSVGGATMRGVSRA